MYVCISAGGAHGGVDDDDNDGDKSDGGGKPPTQYQPPILYRNTHSLPQNGIEEVPQPPQVPLVDDMDVQYEVVVSLILLFFKLVPSYLSSAIFFPTT